MKETQTACVDPDLYCSAMPGVYPGEARALLLAKHSEKETDLELGEKIRAHLERCDFCRRWLNEWEQENQQIPFAICPSSVALDAYIFNRQSLPGEEISRIDLHLQQCPICKEETIWLQKLEQEKVIEFPRTYTRSLRLLSVAAAICFLALAAILGWQVFQSHVTSQQLRALAIVKQPNQIDYANLDRTSNPLPPEWNPLYEEAKVLLREGNFQDAAGRLEKILQSHPNHSASMFLLGYTYYYLDEPEKAFALCDRAEQMHPHSLERCLSLVNIALKTGHFGRAVREINGLYHEASTVPEIRDMYERVTAITRGRTLKL